MPAGSTGIVIDTAGGRLADLLTRLRGLGELVELREPTSAAEANALFTQLFSANADAALSSRAHGGD